MQNLNFSALHKNQGEGGGSFGKVVIVVDGMMARCDESVTQFLIYDLRFTKNDFKKSIT
jgi:hypothetical protein